MPKNWYNRQKPRKSIYRASVDIRFSLLESELDSPELEKKAAFSILDESLRSVSDITYNIVELNKIK
ncbi:hypothetical protein LCGC14_1990280 [marine sediment metagenome]|uniref:Uncharacterized protein n=1 Tax=marine sediment metagenome TaxID=412755 RepID=A0A0F9FUD0_9ZZZZ